MKSNFVNQQYRNGIKNGHINEFFHQILRSYLFFSFARFQLPRLTKSYLSNWVQWHCDENLIVTNFCKFFSSQLPSYFQHHVQRHLEIYYVIEIKLYSPNDWRWWFSRQFSVFRKYDKVKWLTWQFEWLK